MDAAQARLMGKILKDPTALGDLIEDEEEGNATAMSRIMDMATGLAGGDGRLSYGGICDKSVIPEINLDSRQMT